MLQKTKSKKINQLKYALVIPVLALFLMNFNTEKVYLEKDSIKNEKIIEIVFNKNTTLEGLKSQSKILKEKYNINFNFEIINKEKGFADFKYSFDNGIQKHEATIHSFFPFNSIQKNSLILKYNLETKAISMYSIVDDINNKEQGLRYLDNSMAFAIGNNTTKEVLKSHKQKLKEKGVKANFTGIKRNKNNKIIAINISVSSKNSKEINFSKRDNTPIKDIIIDFWGEGNRLRINGYLKSPKTTYNRAYKNTESSSSIISKLIDKYEKTAYFLDGKAITEKELKNLKDLIIINSEHYYSKEDKKGIVKITTKKRK